MKTACPEFKVPVPHQNHQALRRGKTKCKQPELSQSLLSHDSYLNCSSVRFKTRARVHNKAGGTQKQQSIHRKGPIQKHRGPLYVANNRTTTDPGARNDALTTSNDLRGMQIRSFYDIPDHGNNNMMTSKFEANIINKHVNGIPQTFQQMLHEKVEIPRPEDAYALHQTRLKRYARRPA
eukprot:CAMPEP_0194577464 /NCGR_PEP_ID=MMETSP0292-20121207/12244_1 /TAXON_ID=39354 /ORGANISM="Heterosigma akashiwo, Strain CCMP2393" /LENGTH=178 /DNA_ID=CAMNT_0039429869 /DNA_START=411 /DNA_END=943 /DNA_ORIENTATION=-